MGAFIEDCVHAIPILHILQNYSIVHLEAANVLMALKCWVKIVQNASYVICCAKLLFKIVFFF